jgi:hypothetical protein
MVAEFQRHPTNQAYCKPGIMRPEYRGRTRVSHKVAFIASATQLAVGL